MSPRENPSSPLPFQVGQLVRVVAIRKVGQIVRIPEGRSEAEVAVDGKVWKVAFDQLQQASAEERAAAEASVPRGNLPPRDAARVLDLHGMRVEDALEALDKFLDASVVSDLPSVRIIHGHGTGTLREAVRGFLTSHHHVASHHFSPPWEGGIAATTVVLKDK